MRKYFVKNICAHCEFEIQWFPGVGRWLHLYSKRASCHYYTRAEAAPQVKPMKGSGLRKQGGERKKQVKMF